MFGEETRLADHDQATRSDFTNADGRMTFAANLLTHGTRVCLPEISLVAAIFGDALHCAQRASISVTHRESSEALKWIASERHDWPFAFVNVCDFLGVDAKVVRKRLRIRDKRGGIRPECLKPSSRWASSSVECDVA
jgi:hypothetical protein